jgi:hypothetical protein
MVFMLQPIHPWEQIIQDCSLEKKGQVENKFSFFHSPNDFLNVVEFDVFAGRVKQIISF